MAGSCFARYRQMVHSTRVRACIRLEVGELPQIQQSDVRFSPVSPLFLSRKIFMHFISRRWALRAADHSNFRAAARSLGVGQAALSRRVRFLEDEIGVSLFERHRDGASVTIAGRAFFARVRAALDDLDYATEAARAAGRAETGVLRAYFRLSGRRHSPDRHRRRRSRRNRHDRLARRSRGKLIRNRTSVTASYGYALERRTTTLSPTLRIQNWTRVQIPYCVSFPIASPRRQFHQGLRRRICHS